MYQLMWSFIVILLITFPIISMERQLNDIESDVNQQSGLIIQLEDYLKELKDNFTSHNTTYHDILSKQYEAIELVHKVNQFTTLVNDHQNTVSDLRENLNLHEKSTNDTLLRQEQQLAELEPKLLHLENQWRNQSSELGRLKQLWDDLGNKSVARAADVMSLHNSIKGLDERLTQQESKIQEQELKLTTLDDSLGESDETLKSLTEELETAMNKQGQLEGKLTTLEKEIENIRTSSPSVISSPSNADRICGR